MTKYTEFLMIISNDHSVNFKINLQVVKKIMYQVHYEMLLLIPKQTIVKRITIL